MKYIFTVLMVVVIVIYSCVSLAGITNDIINLERVRRNRIVNNAIVDGRRDNMRVGKKEDGKGSKKTIQKINKKVSKKANRRNKKSKKNIFERYKSLSKYQIQNYQKLIKKIKSNHVKKMQQNGFANFVKPAPPVMVFISFSMPSLSLKQITRDASRYKIPVVIRGLCENSFRKTMEKIFDLVKEDNKGGILINPLWFKKYGINAVPAVVVNYEGVQGNIENKKEDKDKNKSRKEDTKKDTKRDTKKEFDVVYGNIPLRRALKIIVDRGSASKNLLKVVEEILSRGEL